MKFANYDARQSRTIFLGLTSVLDDHERFQYQLVSKNIIFVLAILTLDEDFSLATETCRAVEVEFELESAFEE